MQCPACGKDTNTERGLVRHLIGAVQHGGHGLEKSAAERVAHDTAEGRDPSWPIGRSSQAGEEVSKKQQASFTYAVLENLIRNKRLPKYEFERAIDGFLGVFLPGILGATLGGRYRLVAQEFPLKKQGNYQSTNVDYVLYREAEPEYPDVWIFLELKTDLRSVRVGQDEIYASLLASGTTLGQLLNDVDEIRKRSRTTGKYRELLERFKSFPTDCGIEIVYLAPFAYEPKGFRVPVRVLTFQELEDVELADFPEDWRLFRTMVLPALTIQ